MKFNLFKRNGSNNESGNKDSNNADDGLYIGMPVEVFSSEGDDILSGSIFEFTKTDITIIRNAGVISFPPSENGRIVFIRCYTKKLNHLNMKGVVSVGGRIKYVVNGLEIIEHPNQRDNYRLPVDESALVFPDLDEKRAHGVDCLIKNIGLGGCCFVSEEKYEIDSILRLCFRLSDKVDPMMLRCQILRVKKLKGKYEYGVLFAKHDTREEDKLVHMLNLRQSAAIRMH